jgi:hypothetical protein
MKILRFIPLMLLTACATAPKVALHPLPHSPVTDNSTVRYREIVRPYYLGRYIDPNDDLVMHEQHVVYRIEENARWDLRPANTGNDANFPPVPLARDAAFNPLPVSDAVLAEINSQKLATVQITMQARILSAALSQFETALQQTKTNLQATAALRVAVKQMEQRLDTLETPPVQSLPQSISPTNEPPDPLSP